MLFRMIFGLKITINVIAFYSSFPCTNINRKRQ